MSRTQNFCLTLEGPAYTRLFNFDTSVRTYVRPSVSNSFSCVLRGQFTLDPKYFYRFWTPYKMAIRGPDKGAPHPPDPPYGGGGAKIFLGRFLLMDHSDPNRIKYIGKLLTQI